MILENQCGLLVSHHATMQQVTTHHQTHTHTHTHTHTCTHHAPEAANVSTVDEAPSTPPVAPVAGDANTVDAALSMAPAHEMRCGGFGNSMKPGHSHQCPKCSCDMHPFCGLPANEEGYGQKIWCRLASPLDKIPRQQPVPWRLRQAMQHKIPPVSW